MSNKPDLRIGIIGYNFMGKAHSNAWLQANKFFDAPYHAVLKAACGRNEAATRKFADNWGWEHVETDWRKVVARDDIDVIDIATPQVLHHDIAVAAAEAGKHLFCEKPMCLSTAEAKSMLAAAEKAGVRHYLNHNYRRVPAVRLAKKLIGEGAVGRIYHWRCAYQQDWIVDPNFPLTWQLTKEAAGTGPHADLNSHTVDLAHYLVGDIKDVSCTMASFIKQRPLPSPGATAFSEAETGPVEMGEVTVEDTSLMHVEFVNGAIGSFEATRFAAGRRNRNTFEIYGSEGSITFNLEQMNELQVYSRNDPPHAQGFKTVLTTEPCHDYMKNWWPPGHVIGYEHEFVHAAADFMEAIKNGTPIDPDFADGVKTMAVLDAGIESAQTGRRVRVSE